MLVHRDPKRVAVVLPRWREGISRDFASISALPPQNAAYTLHPYDIGVAAMYFAVKRRAPNKIAVVKLNVMEVVWRRFISCRHFALLRP